MDYDEFVQQARAAITEVSAAELAARGLGSYDFIIDVREPHENAAGAIAGAHLIPLAKLEASVESVVSPDAKILVYCAVGARSAIGALKLQHMGYSDVESLGDGYNMWQYRQAQGDTAGLSLIQRERYARHLVLSEVGEAGQQELLNGSVLIVGAGGLGSPAALYLAAAGVGKIGIVDDDLVELSNLQRQVVHNVDRIGQPKAQSAAATIDRINPDCDIRVHQTRLEAGNALDLVGGYDVVIDATDNFPTRYLLNDVSLRTNKPVVHGSIFRFEGQVSVFSPGAGPCYRCLFPEPPPPELAPNCSVAGVLGVLPGIIGSLQAVEAIKLVLGIGEPLIGKLLTYDALEQSFTTLTISRDGDCPACGDPATPPPLVDYDETCTAVAAG